MEKTIHVADALTFETKSGNTQPAEEDERVDEAVWKTAVDSAPWLLGAAPREGEVAPEELFEKLQPFKELVAEHIRDGNAEE